MKWIASANQRTWLLVKEAPRAVLGGAVAAVDMEDGQDTEDKGCAPAKRMIRYLVGLGIVGEIMEDGRGAGRSPAKRDTLLGR